MNALFYVYFLAALALAGLPLAILEHYFIF